MFAATASLILFILLNPWTWPLLPLLFGLSKISILWGAGVAYATSMGALFLSAPWLRVVVVVGLFPSVLLVAATAMTVIAFPLRQRLHLTVNAVLRFGLRSPRGIFPFISSSSAALAFCLGVLATISAWLARLTLSFSTYFGVDPLIFSLGLVIVLLFVCLLRVGITPSVGSSVLGTRDILFLFFGTICIVFFGYHLQALIEILLTIGSTAAIGYRVTSAQLTVLALAPGAVAGYFVVRSVAASLGVVKTAVRVFLVLVAVDLFGAVQGLYAYRDFALSILFNAVGAPIGACIILSAYAILFRRVRTQASNASAQAVPFTSDQSLGRPAGPFDGSVD